MNKKDPESALMKCISELSMDAKTKNAVLDAVNNRQTATAIRILRTERGTALSDMHENQKRLYCIDYVIKMIEQEKTK